jgi:conjugal transfer pilus assembly protein TraK
MKKLCILLVALFTGNAWADGGLTSVPGLPIRPVETTEQASVDARSKSELETLGGMVAQTQSSLAAQAGSTAPAAVKPPPPVIATSIGGSVTIPIAKGQFNRIETPFERALVRHRKDAIETVESDGRAIYVATPSMEPISLHVYEESSPSETISLLLQPSGQIQPINVRLDVGRQHTTLATLNRSAATAFERGEEYTSMLKALMRSLANGEVPPGYGLANLSGATPLMPNCWSPGLRLAPAQLLEGSNLLVVVARVDNPGTRAIEFDESTCAAPGVLAVAAWPDARVDAGGSTELYVVLERPVAPSAQKRPSVIGGRP